MKLSAGHHSNSSEGGEKQRHFQRVRATAGRPLLRTRTVSVMSRIVYYSLRQSTQRFLSHVASGSNRVAKQERETQASVVEDLRRARPMQASDVEQSLIARQERRVQRFLVTDGGAALPAWDDEALERTLRALRRSRDELDISDAQKPTPDTLTLYDDVEYPKEVTWLVANAVGDPLLNECMHALLDVDESSETGTLLVRAFNRRDEIGSSLAMLHAMRQRGVRAPRALYRSLVFACAKYEEIEWGLYVIEQMLVDRHVDLSSFKRMFDACTASVDRRGWLLYDLFTHFVPQMNSLARANLRTSMYLTELMETLGMRRSVRARRGFITLSNPRGEWSNPWRRLVRGVPIYYELDARGKATFNVDGVGADKDLELLTLVQSELEDGSDLRHLVEGTKVPGEAEAQRLFEAAATRLLESGRSEAAAFVSVLSRDAKDRQVSSRRHRLHIDSKDNVQRSYAIESAEYDYTRGSKPR